MRLMRIGLFSVGGIVALAAASALGGSLIWRLGGDDSLTIEGRAVRAGQPPSAQTDWPHYGGDPQGTRYSGAAEITPANVGDLAEAWRFSTGDLLRGKAAMEQSASEATPIIVGDSLVFCTPFNEAIALDPGSGALKWRFDAKIDLEQDPANQFVCRGLAQADVGEGRCGRRVFMGTNDGRLIAIDAESGAPCTEFGDGGVVKIDVGMDLAWPGEFQITSPPVAADGVVVVGSAIGDNLRRDAPAGTLRAYDWRSGAPKWTFDPIPRVADAPGWRAGAPVEGHANVWAPMSFDPARGLLLVGTSSPSPDFFGGMRPGDNRRANSVVAIRIATGEVAWDFQTVRHDVWDYDLPANPSLIRIQTADGARDAVAQTTKQGLVFFLDRDTGAPVHPIEERAAPQDGAPGEALSPTQPFPVTPAIVPNTLDPADAFGLTVFDKRACARAIAGLRREGLYTPPSEQGSLIYPFTGGGSNWGGGAYDPARNLFIVNMSNMAHVVTLIPSADVAEVERVSEGEEVSPQRGTPFGMKREVLLSPLGLPCTPPPWGVIAGVDAATGAIAWRRPIGTLEDLSGGIVKSPLGAPNFGGPIVTAGGLVFIGATLDDYIRALNVETGVEVWRARLPGGGQATPMTYLWKGRQYVVIYAGGHGRAGTRLSDTLLAYALPVTAAPAD